MKYQAIIIDLDGTLLDDQNQIGSANQDSIELAQKHGFKVTLASGRPHQLMLGYAEQLNLTEPMICCNGAYLYTPKSKKVEKEHTFDIQLLSNLLTSLNDAQFDFTLYTRAGVFAQKESTHTRNLAAIARELRVSMPIHFHSVLSELLKHSGEVYKVLVSSPNKHALCEFRNSIQSLCHADLSTPTKLDLTALKVNKGLAVSAWLKAKNIPSNAAIAFGDGDNDASMFRCVGEPVAMANASPALKGLANLIVTDNNGCGIGQHLRFVVQEGL